MGGDYRLTITDSVGCSTQSIVSIPDPGEALYDIAVEQPICPGDFGRITIKPKSSSIPLIFSNDGGETFGLQPDFKNLESGIYQIAVLDESGCLKVDEISIQQPQTLAVFIPDTAIIARPNQEISLEATVIGQAQTIQWLPKEIDSGTLSTTFSAYRDMDVRVIVQDEKGCHVSDALQLSVLLSPIHAPNAFTPNFDGRNDGFTLYSDLESGEIIEQLLIFDRYGNIIFEKGEIPLNIPELGWDGRYQNEKLNPGIYVYQATIRYGNNIKRIVSGDVALIR